MCSMPGFLSMFLLMALFLAQGRMLQPADASTFLAVVAKPKAGLCSQFSTTVKASKDNGDSHSLPWARAVFASLSVSRCPIFFQQYGKLSVDTNICYSLPFIEKNNIYLFTFPAQFNSQITDVHEL